MKQIFIFLFCIVGFGLFGQTRIDSGQIRMVPITKLVTPTTPGSGKVIKYNATSGKWEVGQIGLNQTITENPNFKKLIYQDSTASVSIGSSATNGFLKIAPLYSAESSYPFLLGTAATRYATGTNHVMYMGWNLEPGGGATNSSYPSIGEGWENRWRPDAGTDYTEKHEVWGTTDDTLRRISSWTLNNTTKDGGIYYTANRFSIRRRHQSTPDYFVVQGDARTGATNSSFSLANGYGTIEMSYDKTSGSASNSFTFSNNYNTANTSQFNITGFSTATFPFSSVSLPTSSFFVYGDGTYLQNYSGAFRVLTNTAKPFFHQTPGGIPIESWYDGSSIGVNINDQGTYSSSVSLRIGGTTKGVLFPRLTTTQVNAISSPLTSLWVYDSDVANFKWFDGTRYRDVASVLKGSATLDFPNTSSGNSSDLTITVTGAADGDVVSLGVPNASQTTTGHFFGWVSATNTVTIRYAIAALTGSENPDPGTFKVTVTK